MVVGGADGPVAWLMPAALVETGLDGTPRTSPVGSGLPLALPLVLTTG